MKSVLSASTLYLVCILFVRNVFCQRRPVNTFATEITVPTTFVPRLLRKSCLLKPDPGPCRGNIRTYYFEPETKSCSTFNWGGCMGNGNRFDTESECMDTCLTKVGFKNSKPKWCKLRFDYGFCFGAVERWYYDNLWKVCKKTIYSGCGGNKNNFYNLAQCEEICRFGHSSIISSTRKDTGAKKILIINPWNTTPKRGLDQSSLAGAGVVTHSINATKTL